jgi:D-threo-aldose 1-dehydrogenase
VDVSARTRLGSTDLWPTRLGLGLAPIAGLYAPVPDDQAIATIDRAWEHGVRLFDTAPYYGYGRSERLAGAALARRPRTESVLSTKVGRVIVTGEADPADPWADPPARLTARFDFTAGGVRRSLADSHQRLGTSVDIAHLHDPDDHWEQAAGEAHPALAELRAAGAVAAVSAGMNQPGMLTRFVRERTMDCVLVAGRYTLLDQSAGEQLLPECARRGVGVLVGGVFNSGLLADPHPGATYDYAPASAGLLARARAIGAVCRRYGVPLRAAALQFPFAHPAVTSVLVGARSPGEVDEAVAALRQPVPGRLWQALRDEGVLAPHVPTPAEEVV